MRIRPWVIGCVFAAAGVATVLARLVFRPAEGGQLLLSAVCWFAAALILFFIPAEEPPRPVGKLRLLVWIAVIVMVGLALIGWLPG